MMLVRAMDPEKDTIHIKRLHAELYSYRNWWRPMLLHGTFLLFWKEATTFCILSSSLLFLVTGKLFLLPPISLTFSLTIVLGFHKLHSVLSMAKWRAGKTPCLQDNDFTLLVAEIDGELVGTVGIQWEQQVH